VETLNTPTASIVIPTLNAAPYLPALIPALQQQSLKPVETILVDSGSTDGTKDIAAGFEGVRLVDLDRFTHGRSRNRGVKEASGDIVVLMTQDSVPRNNAWLANLVTALNEPNVVAACSRQIPNDDATPMERFFLQKRFPEAGEIRSLETLGDDVAYEKIVFSDVSCAVKRDTLMNHPYDETLIMSEDQQLARDLILAGYAMAYVPESIVVHSHRYSLWQTFKRYFDSIYALATIFPEQNTAASAKMGMAYVREELAYLTKTAPLWLLYYPFYTATKAAATLLAHHADGLPRWLLKRISMHAYHWK
jgi:rhamnosyltransferase